MALAPGHSRPSSSPRWEWVDWFNNRRLRAPIGNIPPAEADARFYAQIDELAIKPLSLRQTRGGRRPTSGLSVAGSVVFEQGPATQGTYRMGWVPPSPLEAHLASLLGRFLCRLGTAPI